MGKLSDDDSIKDLYRILYTQLVEPNVDVCVANGLLGARGDFCGEM